MTADAVSPCPRCGKRLGPHRWTCRDCRRDVETEARQRRMADGVCVSCRKAKSVTGKGGRCAACREKARLAARRRYQAKRAAGLCAWCGKVPPLDGRALCEGCAAKHDDSRVRADIRASALICVPVEPSAEDKAARGLCASAGCRLPRQPGRDYCAGCLRKGIEAAQPDKPLHNPERRTIDQPLDMPPRQCARCSEPFQPTVMRRLLCRRCFELESRSVE